MIHESTKEFILELYKTKGLVLEGNIIKVLKSDDEDDEFAQYINSCTKKDKETRIKRLTVMKRIQKQNIAIVAANKQIEKVNKELAESLLTEQKSKELIELDLSVLTKKNQNHLLTLIIKTALLVIVGVGTITSLMYFGAIIFDRETQIIGSTWSNMFGIMLTNAFSIVGTIMGVKYGNTKE